MALVVSEGSVQVQHLKKMFNHIKFKDDDTNEVSGERGE